MAKKKRTTKPRKVHKEKFEKAKFRLAIREKLKWGERLLYGNRDEESAEAALEKAKTLFARHRANGREIDYFVFKLVASVTTKPVVEQILPEAFVQKYR